MCKPPPKVTTGAMIVATLSPRVVLATLAVAGSGVALVVVAGSALNAYVWMVLVGWASIASILLLRRRADPRRQMVAAPRPAVRPRATVRVIASRPARALPAAEPHPDAVHETHTVEGWR